MRLYSYVGPKRIAERNRLSPPGTTIESPEDVFRWVRAFDQKPDADGHLLVTFVIDEAGTLRIADRRSEHVACAGGRPVRSAGEMTFAIRPRSVEVPEVSNQSTGYCPEPESWPEVESALRRAGLAPTEGFHPRCVFRRCPNCDAINLVKSGVFECGICGAPLPEAYNCQPDVRPDQDER